MSVMFLQFPLLETCTLQAEICGPKHNIARCKLKYGRGTFLNRLIMLQRQEHASLAQKCGHQLQQLFQLLELCNLRIFAAK